MRLGLNDAKLPINLPLRCCHQLWDFKRKWRGKSLIPQSQQMNQFEHCKTITNVSTFQLTLQEMLATWLLIRMSFQKAIVKLRDKKDNSHRAKQRIDILHHLLHKDSNDESKTIHFIYHDQRTKIPQMYCDVNFEITARSSYQVITLKNVLQCIG